MPFAHWYKKQKLTLCQMHNITVCIPTYKRTESLAQLLDSIADDSFDSSLIKNVDLVVVDNDADRTAEEVIHAFKKKNDKPYRLHYFSYTLKGLSHVRNELIRRG